MVIALSIDGAALRRLRTVQWRRSAAGMAEATGVSASTIYNIETGSPASIDTLDKLARVFGRETVGGLIQNETERAMWLAGPGES